jgi:competence protein ComEA
MTTGERKALLFLATIGVLGAAARAVSAPPRAPSRAERAALAGQIQAVDSARDERARRPARGKGRRERVASAPRSASERSAAPSAIVDLDVADSASIVALPGIGPALAGRIVADRAARGAFGSLGGLDRVRGVGPKLAARLAPHVTFSGVARPSDAAVGRPQ